MKIRPITPVFLIVLFSLLIFACPSPTGGGGNGNGGSQTPTAADYDIGNLTQTAGSVTPVTITPKAGKSGGARTIYYDGAATLPTSLGAYAVTFDVEAATGWNAASGLAAGTLTITALRTANFNSGATDYVIGNLGGTGAWTGGGYGPLNNADSSGNAVNVTGGRVVSGIYGGFHYTDTGDPATAGNNTVNIGSSFSDCQDVHGGYAEVGYASGLEAGKTAAASGNTVNIAGGIFGAVYGGDAASFNGPASASNNTVNFTGGTAFTMYIWGGWANVNDNSSTAAITATGNRVFISGGTVNNAIIGGVSFYAEGTGHATGNTVTISGNPNLTTASLLGGQADSLGPPPPNGADEFTGNTLNLKTAGLTIMSLGNFEEINFYLPSNTANGTTLLTSTNPVYLTGVTVDVAYDTTAPTLAAGNTITLIDNVIGTFTAKTVTISGRTFQLSVSGGKLIATVQ